VEMRLCLLLLRELPGKGDGKCLIGNMSCSFSDGTKLGVTVSTGWSLYDDFDGPKLKVFVILRSLLLNILTDLEHNLHFHWLE
jgi:hypothetical protein